MKAHNLGSSFPFYGAILLALSVLSGTAAAQQPYQPATLLSVEKKVQSTPMSWVWDTAATWSDTVRYDLRIQVAGQVFTAQYIPDVQPDGPIPEEWKPDRSLQIRTDKRTLFIKLSYDREIETRILKRERM
ncbi:MAG TPA: hypothetical protein VH437_08260 [Terriglobales bacterium]|jgi:hypothetical protein